MGISHYIKDIGRGKDGARALKREQASDLFGQLLDGGLSDLEVGAFCLAMRIKGETPQEMAGFLDATHARLQRLPVGAASQRPCIVLPSYNGARKLPALTPLLALLLAREGLPVLVHGTATESARVRSSEVLALLGVPEWQTMHSLGEGQVGLAPTELLLPGLKRLLDVRRVVGLRNSAHSLVKLMNPCEGEAIVVGSYTHPEYALSMAQTFDLMGANALLLRGTEGEPVADPRRQPALDAFLAGVRQPLEAKQEGSLAMLPELPTQVDAAATAAYTQAVLDGRLPVPAPIATQVRHLVDLSFQLHTMKALS